MQPSSILRSLAPALCIFFASGILRTNARSIPGPEMLHEEEPAILPRENKWNFDQSRPCKAGRQGLPTPTVLSTMDYYSIPSALSPRSKAAFDGRIPTPAAPPVSGSIEATKSVGPTAYDGVGDISQF